MNNTPLNKDDMMNISRGAGFFASGGGGEIKLINALIDSIWELPDRKDVYLIAPDNDRFNSILIGKNGECL